jgi:hypothetical protein
MEPFFSSCSQRVRYSQKVGGTFRFINDVTYCLYYIITANAEGIP